MGEIPTGHSPGDSHKQESEGSGKTAQGNFGQVGFETASGEDTGTERKGGSFRLFGV